MASAKVPRWKAIVAATDFSPPAAAAAKTAAALAARGGTVTLVHAVQLPRR